MKLDPIQALRRHPPRARDSRRDHEKAITMWDPRGFIQAKDHKRRVDLQQENYTRPQEEEKKEEAVGG